MSRWPSEEELERKREDKINYAMEEKYERIARIMELKKEYYKNMCKITFYLFVAAFYIYAAFKMISSDLEHMQLNDNVGAFIECMEDGFYEECANKLKENL